MPLILLYESGTPPGKQEISLRVTDEDSRAASQNSLLHQKMLKMLEMLIMLVRIHELQVETLCSTRKC
ncbi:hypothetical protein V6N12_012611 [Hibiscus sabdariffa]|uniref:Uncharacterized protein n=1 Tax=Hibiscus sabdariffa TaxID=183260 RepID=A0ABR2DG02_9ROSI